MKYFCTVPSDKFNIGRTLRFPRCKQIRHDKSWHEAVSTSEFEQLVAEYDPGKYSAVLAEAMLSSGRTEPRTATQGQRGGKRSRATGQRTQAILPYRGVYLYYLRWQLLI